VLGKLIKHDFKTQWLFFAILFGSVIGAPILVFLMTLNADELIADVFRSLTGGFAATAVIILTFIFAAKPFERDFNENSAYLMQTIPVTVRDQIISKAVLYYLWYVLAFVAAVLAVGLANMDFEFVSEIGEYIREAVTVFNEENRRYPAEAFGNYVSVVTSLIRLLMGPLSLFGFIISAMATGHLAGTHKKLGAGLFIVCFIILSTGYTIVLAGIGSYSLFYADSLTASASILYYLDFFISVAVTAAFFIYTHYVYTKKINVL
jgi:hypothetical protein